MRNEFYFTITLTENEHYIVEDMIREYCSKNKTELVYYRKFKKGHQPMYREVKIKGNINNFKKWAESQFLELDNANQKVLNPNGNGKKIEKWLAKEISKLSKS